MLTIAGYECSDGMLYLRKIIDRPSLIVELLCYSRISTSSSNWIYY